MPQRHMIKTSRTHPLRIDELAADGGGGVIGLTFCPGKYQPDALSGHWERDLRTDLQVIREWGAAALVNLLEDHEMRALRVPELGEMAAESMEYFHLPIRDGGVPGPGFEQAWASAGAQLRKHLRTGEKVLVHCKGGLGRTGTVAARLLVELGVDPEEAIRRVRDARPGAIDHPVQEDYLRRQKSLPQEPIPPAEGLSEGK